MIVSGKVSVKAILKARKRPIKRVYILDSHHDKEAHYIEQQAHDLEIIRCTRTEMDELAHNTTHGGYLIECEARLSDAWDELPTNDETLQLMLVEGVSDPYNLGEICRTLFALGFDGLITPSYNFYEHEAKCIRASAGASETLWWHQSSDLAVTLQELHHHNITVVATHRHETSQSLLDYRIPNHICFCLGGAYRGLSKAVLDHSDAYVRIDYQEHMALSTVASAGIMAYETYRQRRKTA